MRNLRIQLGFAAVVLAMLTVVGGVSPAMAWPDKPIAVYVGWSAGGSSDTTTRAVCLQMEKKLGQRILVTNVTGALGGIGATQVAEAPADGYLWFGGCGSSWNLARSGTQQIFLERFLCHAVRGLSDDYLRQR